jgi:hypothetical protein
MTAARGSGNIMSSSTSTTGAVIAANATASRGTAGPATELAGEATRRTTVRPPANSRAEVLSWAVGRIRANPAYTYLQDRVREINELKTKF